MRMDSEVGNAVERIRMLGSLANALAVADATLPALADKAERQGRAETAAWLRHHIAEGLTLTELSPHLARTTSQDSEPANG
jgi:hypothetical protein